LLSHTKSKQSLRSIVAAIVKLCQKTCCHIYLKHLLTNEVTILIRFDCWITRRDREWGMGNREWGTCTERSRSMGNREEVIKVYWVF